MRYEKDVVEDKHLGVFRRTGVRRPPQIGEYYLCERVIGIGLCSMKTVAIREILVKAPVEVRLPIGRGSRK